jgi:hypothetical protein
MIVVRVASPPAGPLNEPFYCGARAHPFHTLTLE